MSNSSAARSGGNGAASKSGGNETINPHAQAVARLCSKLPDMVSDDDIRAVVAALVERAKSGDVAAAREFFNRVLGKPADAPDPDRLELDAVKLKADVVTERNRFRLNKPSPLDLMFGDQD
jgi:hypothetical protein